MKLFNWLFKKEKESNNVNLVNLQDFIKMPPSSFYNEHTKEYQKYYKEYNKILNEKRSLTSIDLSLDENLSINFYSTIITKLSLELANIINPVNQSEERNKSGLKKIMLKFLVYQQEMNEYKNILYIKYKVLKDILTKRIFLKPSKKDTIKSEINNIEGIIIAISNNIHAIKHEIINYYNMISLYEFNDNEKYLSDKYNNLIEYINAFNLNSNFENSLSNIVAMEIMLEKYIIKNDIVKEIENTLENINIETTNYVVIDELIIKSRCIKDLFSKEKGEYLLKKSYQLKYNFIKNSYKTKIVVNEQFKIKTNDEKEYLINYLQKDIFDTLKDTNGVIKITYQDNKRFVITTLRKILSDINLENIFNDSLALSFLFNVTNIDNLRFLFNNIFIKDGNKTMSLTNYIMNMYCLKDVSENKDYINYYHFFLEILDDKEIFYVPEGLVDSETDFNKSKEFYPPYWEKYDYQIVNSLFARKKVVFPSQLKKAKLYNRSVTIEELYLNEGLEEINYLVNHIYEIYVPSSVKEMSASKNTLEYIFDDCNNSLFFNDAQKFKTFIKRIYLQQSGVLHIDLDVYHTPVKIILKNGENKFVYEIRYTRYYSLNKKVNDIYNKMQEDLKNDLILKRGK